MMDIEPQAGARDLGDGELCIADGDDVIATQLARGFEASAVVADGSTGLGNC
jgi:hypothetical protein